MNADDTAADTEAMFVKCRMEAIHALRFALADDLEKAVFVTAAAHTLYGDLALITCAVTWARFAAITHGRSCDRDRPVSIKYLAENGDPLQPEDVPPPQRWAARLIAAEAKDDVAMIDALLEVVPPDSYPEHTLATLVTAAQVITDCGGLPEP